MLDNVLKVWSTLWLEKKAIVDEMPQLLGSFLLRRFKFVTEVADRANDLCRRTPSVWHLTSQHFKQDHAKAVNVAGLCVSLFPEYFGRCPI